jgi:hypothetical protein
VHALIKNLAVGSAQCLGAAHGHVGIIQQVFRTLMRRRAERNPNAERNPHFVRCDWEWIGHSRLQSLRHAHGVAGIAERVE